MTDMFRLHYSYRSRDYAEREARTIAIDEDTPMAVFDGFIGITPATSICPLSELHDAAKLLVIYEPRA